MVAQRGGAWRESSSRHSRVILAGIQGSSFSRDLSGNPEGTINSDPLIPDKNTRGWRSIAWINRNTADRLFPFQIQLVDQQDKHAGDKSPPDDEPVKRFPENQETGNHAGIGADSPGDDDERAKHPE